MSRVPGAFSADVSSDTDNESLPLDEDLSALLDDADMQDDGDDDSNDDDFIPGDMTTDADDDDDDMAIAEDDDNDNADAAEGESRDDQSGGGADGGGGGGGQQPGTLRIGYDTASRQILVVDEHGHRSRLTSADLRGSSLTMSSLRRMLAARFGGIAADDDDGEEDDDGMDDDDDEDSGLGSYWGSPRRPQKQWYDIPTEPQPPGEDLERSGDFGPPPVKYSKRKVKTRPTQIADLFKQRELACRLYPKAAFGDFTVPQSAGTEVAQFMSKVYSGQYSQDGSFFYSAVQDQRVYIYDTRTAPRTGSKSVTDSGGPLPGDRRRRFGAWEHRSSMKTRMIVKALDHSFRWTTTDANLSPDNEWLIYSSITPRIHLVRTRQGEDWTSEEHDQEILDVAAGSSMAGGYGGFGIWSIRFSNDGKEIVAGGNTGGGYHGQLFVYDVEAKKTILKVPAHVADVNAVAFADTASSNLLLSGSDDSFIKVWDRRSLSGQRASGTLVGHTEGITFVAPKGDGRYCISNGKDQAVKLWDLRMMMSDDVFERLRLDRRDYGIPGWDYREAVYRKPHHLVHPHDVSVMTYRGHSVLRTLIRCHFSPGPGTSQRYIYSGSADGRIHIWSLDGRVVRVLDRRNTRGLINSTTGEYNDPSDPEDGSAKRVPMSAVRDVSWHPTQPAIMSTAWGGMNHSEGTLAMHQWKPRIVGETLEDQVTRMEQEAEG